MLALRRLINGSVANQSTQLEVEKSAPGKSTQLEVNKATSKQLKDMLQSPVTSSNTSYGPLNSKKDSGPLSRKPSSRSSIRSFNPKSFKPRIDKRQMANPLTTSSTTSPKTSSSSSAGRSSSSSSSSGSSPLNPNRPSGHTVKLPHPHRSPGKRFKIAINPLPRDAMFKNTIIQNQMLRQIVNKRLDEIQMPDSNEGVITEILTLREKVSLLTKEVASLRTISYGKLADLKIPCTLRDSIMEVEEKRWETDSLRETVGELKKMLGKAMEEMEKFTVANGNLQEPRKPSRSASLFTRYLFGGQSSQAPVEKIGALHLGYKTGVSGDKEDTKTETGLALLRKKDKEIEDMRATHEGTQQEWRAEKTALEQLLR